MNHFIAELIGTCILVLLGDGVVAGVLLKKSKAENAGWKLTRKLTLFHQEDKKAFRLLMRFQRTEFAHNVHVEPDLYIYEKDGTTHDPRFKELLKAFYLKF